MSEKIRLDILIKLKYGFSREYSKHLINSGNVCADNIIITKAGALVSKFSDITIEDKAILKYVSRGGLKLEKAINIFKINLKGKVCIDVGASTGGFTDCMLQNRALKVYAVDVGNNQLSNKLVNNKSVISIENTNIKEINKDIIKELCCFAAIDVSFISLSKVLPYVLPILIEDGEIVALIKPQFEVGKHNVGKNGVVKDFKVHKKAIEDIYNFSLNMHLGVLSFEYSPIKGRNGNVEYLIHLKKNFEGLNKYNFDLLCNTIIDNAKNTFKNQKG